MNLYILIDDIEQKIMGAPTFVVPQIPEGDRLWYYLFNFTDKIYAGSGYPPSHHIEDQL